MEGQKLELEYERAINGRRDLLIQELTFQKENARTEADYYKLRSEYHEKKLDSIYSVALLDNDKTVLEFFTNKQWRSIGKDR